MTKIKYLVFCLLVSLTFNSHGGEIFEITKFVQCDEGFDLEQDKSNIKDICVSISRQETNATTCPQMSRSELTDIVSLNLGVVDRFKQQNIIEFLHMRTFRMKKHTTRGRDYCSVSIKKSDLRKFAQN